MRLPDLLVACAAVLALAVPAAAEILPRPSVDRMCQDAELIVEGRHDGRGVVSVTRLYRRPDGLAADTTHLRVPRLTEHALDLGAPWDETSTLETDHVVLFLSAVEGSEGTWEPLHTLRRDAGRVGSAGTIWIADEHCHAYTQAINPGPYYLFRVEPTQARRVPMTVAALRTAIEDGLRRAATWRETLALPDRVERAKRLAAYLDARSSPDGELDTRLYDVRAALAPLGADAVEPLRRVLAAKPGDWRLSVALDVVGDLGALAEPLLPVVIPLAASDNDSVLQGAMLALGKIGDSRGVPAVAAHLADERFWCVEIAAEALAGMRDVASFDAIAARLPETPDPTRAGPVSDVLRHLDSLDPERARPLLDRYIAMPEMASTVRFLRSVRKGAHRAER